MSIDYKESLAGYYVSRTVPPMVQKKDYVEEDWPSNARARDAVRYRAADENNCFYLPFWVFVSKIRPNVKEDDDAMIDAMLNIKIDNITSEYLTSFNVNAPFNTNHRVPVVITPHFEDVNLDFPAQGEAQASHHFAQDVSDAIYKKIRDFIYGCMGGGYITPFDGNNKLQVEWVVVGDPYLIRYLTISGEKHIGHMKVIYMSSVNHSLRRKLYVYPIIRDEAGNVVTLFRIEQDERMKTFVNDRSTDDRYGEEGHLRIVTTVPVLGRFNSVVDAGNLTQPKIKIEIPK